MQPIPPTTLAHPPATQLAPPTAPSGLKVVAFVLIILNTLFTIGAFYGCMQVLTFDPANASPTDNALYTEVPGYPTFMLVTSWAQVAISLGWIAIGFSLLRASKLGRNAAHVLAVITPIVVIAGASVMLAVFAEKVLEASIEQGFQASGNNTRTDLTGAKDLMRLFMTAQQIGSILLITAWCAAIVFTLHTRSVRNFFAARSTHDYESTFVYPKGYPAVHVAMPAAKRTGPKRSGGTSADIPTLAAREAAAPGSEGDSASAPKAADGGASAPTLADSGPSAPTVADGGPSAPTVVDNSSGGDGTNRPHQ